MNRTPIRTKHTLQRKARIVDPTNQPLLKKPTIIGKRIKTHLREFKKIKGANGEKIEYRITCFGNSKRALVKDPRTGNSRGPTPAERLIIYGKEGWAKGK